MLYSKVGVEWSKITKKELAPLVMCRLGLEALSRPALESRAEPEPCGQLNSNTEANVKN
jgi:hypothetical protein